MGAREEERGSGEWEGGTKGREWEAERKLTVISHVPAVLVLGQRPASLGSGGGTVITWRFIDVLGALPPASRSPGGVPPASLSHHVLRCHRCLSPPGWVSRARPAG